VVGQNRNVGSSVRMLRRRTLFASAIAGLALPMTSALARPGPPPGPPAGLPGGRPPPSPPLGPRPPPGRPLGQPPSARRLIRPPMPPPLYEPDRLIQSARTVGTGCPAGGIRTVIAGFGDTATGATSTALAGTGGKHRGPGSHLYFPRRASVMPKVRAFIDAARDVHKIGSKLQRLGWWRSPS